MEDQDSPSVTMSLAELKGLMAETAKEAARAALKEDHEKLASRSQAASGTFGARAIIHKLQPTIDTNAGSVAAQDIRISYRDSMHVLVVTYKMFRRALLQNRRSERYQQHPPFTAFL